MLETGNTYFNLLNTVTRKLVKELVQLIMHKTKFKRLRIILNYQLEYINFCQGGSLHQIYVFVHGHILE